MKKNNEQYPLILVFYLDRILMQEPQILKPFTDLINDTIAERDANIMALFMPTDDNERIECLNPLMATEEEKGRITKMLDEMTAEFSIGGDLNDEGSSVKPFKSDES